MYLFLFHIMTTTTTTKRGPSPPSEATTSLLLSAVLEAWCHQLLYVRNVYPRNSFANTYCFLQK